MTFAGDVASLPLSHGARRVAERALSLQRSRRHEKLGVNHWLLALLERHGSLAEALAEGMEAAAARQQVRRRLEEGSIGDVLELEDVVARSTQAAGREAATERDLASAILAAARYRVRDQPVYDTGLEAEGTPVEATPVLGTPAPGPAPVKRTPVKRRVAPVAAEPTPTLDEFGVDLTREAREGRLPAIVGRENEIRQVCTTLCRRTKRNPALIGPAGSGKTAIVEGLAQRVVAGEVPELLKGVRIVALQPSSLVAGAKFAGQLEERVKAVLAEAEQPGIILFIDELHSIVGSGGLVGSTDIGAQLKPALARGVSCIGATTDDEYRRFIERDRALERRFRPIAVEEMSPADTLMVLDAHRDLLWELRGVEVPDEVLQWLLDFCEDFLRNRVFPDKAVDLLEQCVATAVMNDESAVDVPRASAVAQEMVGMPIDLGGRLASLARRLTGAALLDADGSEELLERVGITMRGLDLHPSRPNAVILLADRAAESTEELAVAIAETLLGDPGRVVEFDFGQLDRSEDVNTLLGAPPAYIGFGEHLPLHDLARMPWSVLVCKNVDGCHPQVLEVLAQALEDGFLTERSGRRIYLSDAVVILSAPSKAAAKRPPGFHAPGSPSPDAASPDATAATSALEEVLGSRILEQVDVVSTKVAPSVAAPTGWIESSLLPGLAEQYRAVGLNLAWDPTFVTWVREQHRAHPSRILLTRLVEACLGQALIPHLPARGGHADAMIEVRDGLARVADVPRTSGSEGRHDA
jgi:ATP-dependent Clp protease ATP-binding subunit ClpC